MKSVRSLVYLLLSLLCTGLVFNYLFSQLTLAAVVNAVREINLSALIIFLNLSILTSILRTWRYSIILSESGHSAPPIPLFLIVLARNFLVDFLPSQIGGAAYIYLINDRLRIPLAPATSSFALAMIFDLLALGVLLVFVLLLVALPQAIPPLLLIIAVLILFSVSLVLLLFLPRIIMFVCHYLANRKGGTKRIIDFLSSFAAELERAKQQGIFSRVLLISLLIRITKYLSLYVFLFAIIEPLGYHFAELPPLICSLGILAAEVAASLPVSGIAGFGAYEGTWAFVFQLIGFPSSVAALTAVTHRLLTQIYGASLGIFALLMLMLPHDQSVRYQMPRSSFHFTLRFLSAVVAILLLGALLTTIPRSPAVAEQQVAKDVAVSQLAPNSLSQQIVFDSNRSGTFGIYSLPLAGGDPVIISDSPLHEMYPDIAPNGDAVVFSRVRSTSRNAPGEIWVWTSEGKERLVATDGTYPTWSSSGREIYFERGRRKVIAVTLTGEEREIFPRDSKEFNGHQIVKPRVSPDGKFVAFTSDRPSPWSAWVADLRTLEAKRLNDGCEPVWFDDSQRLAFIRNEGAHDGSGIYETDSNKKPVVALQDLSGAWGHEYFPSVFGDQLLYSATTEAEHSHLTGRYQIFIKDLKTSSVRQLTNDGFTNRWPKTVPSQITE